MNRTINWRISLVVLTRISGGRGSGIAQLNKPARVRLAYSALSAGIGVPGRTTRIFREHGLASGLVSMRTGTTAVQAD